MPPMKDEYDYILLDFPAGLGRDMVALGARCDYRTMVVTPDKSSLTDTYGLMKILCIKSMGFPATISWSTRYLLLPSTKK